MAISGSGYKAIGAASFSRSAALGLAGAAGGGAIVTAAVKAFVGAGMTAGAGDGELVIR
jgi:hypothetical protein